MPTVPNHNWCLAALRQSKGVSIEDIAAKTKLRMTIVTDIENGNFDALPGGIYNISYLRQYARAVGVDETALVELYRQSYPDAIRV